MVSLRSLYPWSIFRILQKLAALLSIGLVLLIVAACNSSSTTQGSATPTGQTTATATMAPTATATENIPIRSSILTYKGHSAAVVGVAWSPDGKRIASASNDATVQVWDAMSGKQLWSYNAGLRNYLFAVAWSPDGKRLATAGGDAKVHLLDAATGHLLASYGNQAGFIEGLAWSPDSKKIASGSQDNSVEVLDTTSGKILVNYTGHADAVNRVAWSPDRTRIASASHDGTVQVWDATNGHPLLTYHGHTTPVWSVAWSPDSKKIVSGTGAAGNNSPVPANNVVKVWDATTGQTLLTYTAHGSQSQVYGLAWSPDGTRIAST